MATVKKNIIANFFGQAWTGFMAVAFLPLYIHYLGVEAYGLIGIFTVVQALVMILDMGMSPTLNREIARYTVGCYSVKEIRDLLRSLELICFGLAVFVIVIAWFASDFIAKEWIQTEQIPVAVVIHALALMALVAALRLCEGIYRGALYGMEQQVWYNCTYSLISTLRYGGALVILEWVSTTIEAFFVWQACVSFLTVAVLSSRVYLSLPKVSSPAKYSRILLMDVWKFAGGMLGITFLTMFFLQLDKVLLASLVPLKELGYYSLATTAANVMFMIVVPVTQAVYPQLVKTSSSNDQSRMSTIYHQTSQMVTVLTASATMLLCFFSGGVVYMWSGNQDLVLNAAPLISILVIGCFLNGLSYLPHQLQIAHGWTSLLLKANAIVVIAFALLLWLIVPHYGVRGAAWVWVAMNVVYLLVTSHCMHNRLLLRQKWQWYFKDTLLPTCGAISVMLVAENFKPENYDDRFSWFVFLLITGIVALLVSSTLAVSFRDRIVRLLRGIDG